MTERKRPPATSLRPSKTAELVARAIVADIGRRGLRKGERLASEKDMIEEYGVARATLREALRYLELQQILTIRQGPSGGPVVNGEDRHALAPTLSLLLEFSKTPFSTIVESRRIFEPIAAQLAARRADAESLALVSVSMERMENGDLDLDEFFMENQDFHEAVAWASGNRVLAYVISSLQWIFDGKVVGVEYREGDRATVIDHHRRIFSAIERHDSQRAYAEADAHLDVWQRYVERKYKHLLDDIVRWR